MVLNLKKAFNLNGVLAISSFILIGFFTQFSMAYTNVQTSTSFGYYRDYQKTNHTPLFHSWSINGIYEDGVETSVDFYLNNDFTTNEWNFYPTQLQVTVPINSGIANNSQTKSQVKLGRQFYAEGFDLSLLDGVQAPIYLSATGGFMPVAGYLRSTDFEQPSDLNSPLLGLIIWEQFSNLHLRGGYTARDVDLANQFVVGSMQYQFSNILWQPAFFYKEELTAKTLTFNQSTAELLLHFSETFDGRMAYSNLDPRPTNKSTYSSFVYRLFSISPTETVMSDVTWAASEKVVVTGGVARSFYNSGYRNEVSDKQEASFNYQFGPDQGVTPILTHVETYGGQLTDLCLRYWKDIGTHSRYVTEFDTAYVTKINSISGWLEHFRGSYETHVWSRAKVLFALELERNQYFEFDVRTMAYVTNYL